MPACCLVIRCSLAAADGWNRLCSAALIWCLKWLLAHGPPPTHQPQCTPLHIALQHMMATLQELGAKRN